MVTLSSPRRKWYLVPKRCLWGIPYVYLVLMRWTTRQWTLNDHRELMIREPSVLVENFKKPLFILHVGIAKSATTTIQADLASSAFTEALKADGYLYLGMLSDPHIKRQRSKLPCNETGSYKAIQECRRLHEVNGFHNSSESQFHPHVDSFAMRTLTGNTCHKQLAKAYKTYQNESNAFLDHAPCFTAVQYELRDRAQKGQNVIYSNEDYSMQWLMKQIQNDPWTRTAFLQALEPFDVRVVVAYRRYAAWLLSSKGQCDKERYWTKQCQRWSGKCYQSNWSTIQSYRRKQVAYKFEYTHQALQLYRDVFGFPTTILNYHSSSLERQPTTVPERFFCQMLPHAPHTCHAAKMQESETRRNRAQPRILEPLIVAAEQRGLLDRTKHTNTVKLQDNIYKRIQQSNQSLATVWPYKCPPKKELDSLLNETLHLEQLILPDFAASNEDSLRSDFDKLVSFPPNFCEVDVEAVLQPNFASWEELLDHFVGPRAPPSLDK